MKYIFTLIFCFTFLFPTLHSQKNGMIFPDLKGKATSVNKGSDVMTSECEGTLNPKYISSDWNVVLKNIGAYHHTASLPSAEFDKLKQAANEKRTNTKIKNESLDTRNSTIPPHIGRNFRGNIRGNNIPMDNSMAISPNGFIVSGINSNIVFIGPDGKSTYSKGLPDFFTLLGLGTRMYDPRVIYDVEANRFIFMCLHGSEPSNTFLCLAFSKTEDPNGEWNYYKVDGNPSGDNHWFDYPNIALSKHDFYIAGLMRDTPGDWKYSVLYQIDKNDGYEGKPLMWKYYNELKDADNKPSFNLVPTPSGWNNLTDPGMYFVSNNSNGGNTYNLYYTTASLKNNPSLISLQTIGTATELAPDGRQKNNSNVLNTFDSRIWSAMYLNGTIHMGSHVNTPNGDVGLFYGRIKVADLDLHTDILTTKDRDFAFPSFSAFGQNEGDDDILVNYLFAGPDIFPGQQQRLCKGKDSSFEWSEPVTLKEGLGFVDALADNNERWGDYTTSCRRFFDGRVESWITGCFGESSSYGTWLGQFIREADDKMLPMAEFIADSTTLSKGSTIKFNDLTAKNPVSWKWTFEGGEPATSEVNNPEVFYRENGAYDVTLIVSNDLGIDTITKKEYIHIQDPVTKPVANFTFDRDTIFKDESVQFKSQSSDNAITHKWTFTSGTPANSTEKDPLIKYTKVGSFIVALTVANIAGTGTKVVSKAITVLNRSIPKANITADKKNIFTSESVQFSDASAGGPVSRKWFFEGGLPDQSTDPNPLVRYDNEGKFDVKLVVENEFGVDSITLQDFITSTTSATVQQSYIENVKLYPNPVQNDMVNCSFNNAQTDHYRIDITNVYGNNIFMLYNDKIKSGENQLSFRTTNLSSGQYFLTFSSHGKPIKTLPFTVLK
jgi:PKD repeat protein